MKWGRVFREVAPGVFDGFTNERGLVGSGSLVAASDREFERDGTYKKEYPQKPVMFEANHQARRNPPRIAGKLFTQLEVDQIKQRRTK